MLLALLHFGFGKEQEDHWQPGEKGVVEYEDMSSILYMMSVFILEIY